MDHIVDLESCTLKKLKSTGRQIGHSAYCSVHEVEVDGVACAAKRIFPMLIQSRNDSEGTEKTKKKFVKECILMSKLHHPHILQFIGVYYPSAEDEWYSSCLTYGMTPGLPWLVMENLPYTLEETLLKRPNIPTCVKVSFLLDITKGLLYLHNRDIYHRNLTAGTVSITSSMVAKIADFGVAKIFSCQSATVDEYTPLPGNYLYMPPEADQERSDGGTASYGNTIDIFSFGVIVLFTITQTSPYDLLLLPATYPDPDNPRQLAKGRTEVERRREHFDIAKRNVRCAEDNEMIELCQSCLLNDPKCRPNAEEILETLTDIEKKIASNSATELWKMDKLELMMTLKNQRKVRNGECPLSLQLEEDNTRLHEAEIQIEECRRRAENAEREVQEYQRREEEEAEAKVTTEWIVERNEIEFTTKEVGRGGWGTVTVAIFRGTEVAAKCFYRELSSDYYQGMFTREMTMAARLRHPNMVQFIGASVKPGNVIILTELMTTSLRTELEKGPMNQQQITSISLDVARALNYLHLMQPHPIIHRDISSANVLLDPLPGNGWKVKVSDYGSVNVLTCLRTVGPGNPVYAAPEANVPALQSPKMDIFSFGILLVEMLTHQFPEISSRQRLIASIDHAGYLDLIEECLSEDKDNRPSAQLLLARLNDIITLVWP